MKYLFSLIICTLLLTACGTRNYQYQSEKNSAQWKGRNIADLQNQWGAADQTVHTRSGNSYYVYVTNSGSNFYTSTKSNFDMGSESTPNLNDAPMRGPSFGGMGLKCTTAFKTDANGTIIATSHSGSNCGGEWTRR